MQRSKIRTIEEILNILTCSEKNREILIDISKTYLVVFDFDLYKIKEKITRETVKATLLKLCFENKWTVVRSPSGGLHIYFSNKESYFEHMLNKTLKCLIPNVDIIRRKIVGPNIKELGLREIVYFNFFLPIVPLSFYPLSLLQTNKEIVLAAVINHGSSLQYASSLLKNNKEIVLAAVMQDGHALKYSSDLFQNDEEIIYESIKQISRFRMNYYNLI